MGIGNDSARFLIAAKEAGVEFSDTITLGRQWLFADAARLGPYSPDQAEGTSRGRSPWADAFLRNLGAVNLRCLDQSPFEGATLLYDLGSPLPPELHDTCDFLFDGGTLEHIYDFPVAVRNCMALLRRGGHMCLWTPANNECGHGFYQFSPELFFRLFSRRNGFQLRSLMLVEQRAFGSRWYAVRDPAAMGERVCCVNTHPLFLLVLAKKIAPIPESLSIYQSDYLVEWGAETEPASLETGNKRHGPGLKNALLRCVLACPGHIPRKIIRMYRSRVVYRLSNRKFFTPVKPETFVLAE